MTKQFEKEAKERAKDYTENKERQVAYECGFLDGADVLEREIKTMQERYNKQKEINKALVEEYESLKAQIEKMKSDYEQLLDEKIELENRLSESRECY